MHAPSSSDANLADRELRPEVTFILGASRQSLSEDWNFDFRSNRIQGEKDLQTF